MPRKSRTKTGRTSHLTAKARAAKAEPQREAAEKRRSLKAARSLPLTEVPEARRRLNRLICETIAQDTPFSLQEILSAYETLGSFDLVLTACDYAAQTSIHLSNVIDMLRLTEVERAPTLKD